MVVPYRELPCGVGHGHRELARRIDLACQHIHNGLRAALGRAPALQYGIQLMVRNITGNGPPVQMHANQRLAQSPDLADERVLSCGQVNICAVHARSHGGDRAGTVLSAKGQDHKVRVLGNFKGPRESAFVGAKYVIARGVANFDVRQPVCQLLKKVPAVREELLEDRVKLLRLVQLYAGAWNSLHLNILRGASAARAGH